MADNSPKRVRVSVPSNDMAVLAWLDAQVNISASVRELIRREVKEHGIGDMYASFVPDESGTEARPPAKRKRAGRPKGVATGAYATQKQSDKTDVADTIVAASNPKQDVQMNIKPAISAARSGASRRPKRASSGSGIQLSSDSLGEFGVDLDIDDDSANEDAVTDALGVISDMMNN